MGRLEEYGDLHLSMIRGAEFLGDHRWIHAQWFETSIIVPNIIWQQMVDGWRPLPPAKPTPHQRAKHVVDETRGAWGQLNSYQMDSLVKAIVTEIEADREAQKDG